MKGVFKDWNRLPGNMMESPPLKKCEHGTKGHGLGMGLGGSGWCLHLMILKVCSNLDDSIINCVKEFIHCKNRGEENE